MRILNLIGLVVCVVLQKNGANSKCINSPTSSECDLTIVPGYQTSVVGSNGVSMGLFSASEFIHGQELCLLDDSISLYSCLSPSSCASSNPKLANFGKDCSVGCSATSEGNLECDPVKNKCLMGNGSESICTTEDVCAPGLKCCKTRHICYYDDPCQMSEDEGFLHQIQVGDVTMSAAFDLAGPEDFGSKLCWSAFPLSRLHYCINPTTCPNQDSDLANFGESCSSVDCLNTSNGKLACDSKFGTNKCTMNTGSICYNNAVCNSNLNAICSSTDNTCQEGSFLKNNGAGTCLPGEIFTGNACHECGSWDINSYNGPAMARIFVGGAKSPISAGVVVSKYAILTVASALIDADSNYVDASSINVFLGVSDKTNPRYVYAVDRIEPFVDFDSTDNQYNIALIILKTEIVFDNDVQPACIPSNPTIPSLNTDGVRFGWSDINDAQALNLQFLAKKIIPTTDFTNCLAALDYNQLSLDAFDTSDLFNSNSSAKQFCAGGVTGDRCYGFNGEPFFISESDSRVYIGGLGSLYTKNCEIDGSIYTRISSYFDWLNSILIAY